MSPSGAALDLNNPRNLRRKLLEFSERMIELEDRVEVLTPKAEVFDQTSNEKKRPTIAALVRKMAGVNSNATKRDLLMLGYFYRTGGSYPASVRISGFC